jgi:amino acid transporter
VTSGDPHPQDQPGELKHGVLGLGDAFAQSFALLSLALASSLATSLVAADAGVAAPFAYIVAGAGSLCLASVIVRFTRRMASAGGVYTYSSRGLGAEGGFLSGWLYAGGFAAGISFVMIISGFFMNQVMDAHVGIHLGSDGWFWWFLILMAVLTAIALRDIRISTRTQLVIGVASVAAITLLLVIVLAKGGDSGVTLTPLDPSQLPSTHGLFLAVVLAFTGFIGFEAAASLGEEAADPLRVIPRAILIAIGVGIVYYVFLAWVMAVGFGVDHIDQWATNPAALDALASRYAGTWLAVIVDLAVSVGAFVAALAGVNLTARTVFAMAREGGMPRRFAWTHPSTATPWVAIGAVLGLTLLLVVVLGRIAWNDPFKYFGFMATTATFPILGAYILIAIAGMIFFWRSRSGDVAFNVVFDALLPLGAIAICGYTIYESFKSPGPAPNTWSPWIALGWLVAGIVVLAWLKSTHPDRVRSFGSILGTGEAAATDQAGATSPTAATPDVAPGAS